MARTALQVSLSRTIRIAVFSLMLGVGLTMALWLDGSVSIGRYSIDIAGSTTAIGLVLSALIFLVGLYGLSRSLRS
jgi:hypothetical protein